VVKNKVAPPYKTCKVDLIYGEGFSKDSEVLDLALEYGFAKKSGSWFEILGERVGQGKDAAKAFLKEHPDVYENVYNQVIEAMRTKI
jgi:recombination protein RecA